MCLRVFPLVNSARAVIRQFSIDRELTVTRLLAGRSDAGRFDAEWYDVELSHTVYKEGCGDYPSIYVTLALSWLYAVGA